MDFTSGLKDEIFRPTVVIIIPGVIGAGPFAVWAIQSIAGLKEFLASNSLLGTFLGFLMAVTFGLIATELGAFIEARGIERIVKQGRPSFEEDWYKYLRCTLPDDLVGRGYIHTLVMHLHFELNFSSSLVICWFGCLLLTINGLVFSSCEFYILTAVQAVLIAYLVYEAYDSATVLARVRNELLKGFGLPPIT